MRGRGQDDDVPAGDLASVAAWTDTVDEWGDLHEDPTTDLVGRRRSGSSGRRWSGRPGAGSALDQPAVPHERHRGDRRPGRTVVRPAQQWRVPGRPELRQD